MKTFLHLIKNAENDAKIKKIFKYLFKILDKKNPDILAARMAKNKVIFSE